MKPLYEDEHRSFFDAAEILPFMLRMDRLHIFRHNGPLPIELTEDDGSMGAPSGKYVTIEKDDFYIAGYDLFLVWREAQELSK